MDRQYSSRLAERYARPADEMETPVTKDDPRDRLIAAALAEFASRGYDGTTLASVARRCGVTQPLLHYHFGNKENLWREAVQPGLFRHRDAIQAIVDAGDLKSPVATLERICRRFVRFGAENPDLARVLSNEAFQPSEHIREMVMRHGVPILEGFAKFHQRAVEKGAVRDTPAEHALLIVAGAAESFLRFRRLSAIVTGAPEPTERDIQSYEDTVVEICFRGLLPQAG